jgi:hypothetical protein
MYAEALGGDGANGGGAFGGYTILQSFDGSTVNVVEDVLLSASAFGGLGSTGFGGDAYGGNIDEGVHTVSRPRARARSTLAANS